jgi:hypothetical protein
MDTHQERMGANVSASQEVTEACLESKEPTSLEILAEHEEVPKEEATVQTVRALKKQHWDRHLAKGHH